MKNISFLLVFFAVHLTAQSGYDIRVKMSGYHVDSLWFGHTFCKRAVPDVPAAKGADGYFHFHSDEPTEPGLYAIVFKRGSSFQYMSCWLAEGQRQFTIETDFFQIVSSTKAIGSAENEALYDYFRRYYPLSDSLDDLTNAWKDAQDEPSFRAMVGGQEALRQYQESFIEKYPNSLTADVVRQTLFVTPPAGQGNHAGWQAEAEARHKWMRQHFFDRMDLANGQFQKQPLWVDRTDYYFSKLPPPLPDSLVAMAKDVFHRLQPDTAAYHYYFGYVMNSLSRMSRYRTDEAFYHLVREYLDSGQADFLSRDRTYHYRSEADRMEPLFVGKKCPDVTLYNRENKPISIYGIDAPYTLMVFWLYDCGHCKKEIPLVEDVYERFKSKGLQVMSVCGKSGPEETPKCWDFADKMKMPGDWLILDDPQRRSRFNTLLNVHAFPRMILLDKDKNILFKQTGEVTEEVLIRDLARVVN